MKAMVTTIVSVFLSAACGLASEDSMRVAREAEGYQFYEGSHPVLFYRTTPLATKEGTYRRANYCHPVYGLDGEVLTEDFPTDHLHHRGIFWAWHQVYVGDKPMGDMWACQDLTWDIDSVQILRPKPNSAAIQANVYWKSSQWKDEAEPFAQESVTIRVHKTTDNIRLIDFDLEIRALVEGLRIGGSNDIKGYGGFSTRIVLPLDIQMSDTNGPVTPQNTAVPTGDWMNFSGTFGETPSNFAILVHPSHPGHPHQWILRKTGSAQNLAFPGRDPIPISTTDPLILRYRLVLHKNADLNQLFSQYSQPRERISLNADWRFHQGDPNGDSTSLIYDVRPEARDVRDDKEADTKPTEAEHVEKTEKTLKPWILPTGNDFVKDPTERHARPSGAPEGDVPYVRSDFDDRSWDRVDLPHDWAIQGPFHIGWGMGVGGGMGRLPSPGVGWYRKKFNIPASDVGKCIFLDIDGAMSYAIVWLNGKLVGGWPYGYASWRVDLTPYIEPGRENQLAIRLDNPPNSSRWYPGGGLYRNVWLVKTQPVHIGQWGTFVTTRDVSQTSATIDFAVTIDNDSDTDTAVEAVTEVFALDSEGQRTGEVVARFEPLELSITANQRTKAKSTVILDNPRLWGPPPTQHPHRYVAVTTLRHQGQIIDRYETPFGIRSLHFDPNKGIHINGERIYIKGVNQHHDLGALGAAFNMRAAERQLERLHEMGSNAIRTAHNPPAPELLELADRMGFLVVDEIFDVWEMKKTPLDFHLIFPDWYEQDTRTFVRRDRNHPSVILWSVGNEVGEQYTGEKGAAVAKRLCDIVKEEDPTRPTTAAMNWAKPDMPLPKVVDVISLNYQGEGIRNAPAYAGLKGIRTPPLYAAFHEAFPDKVILSSENAAALSSRGTYLFPVTSEISAPVKDGLGGDPKDQYVNAYELYTAPFGSSADKVFATQEKHPFVAGGFVWSGWDYLGEPTPYYGARSSYYGIIDLAGFKKDRFYLYQSQWRPDLPMAHILPHWTWPDRVGKVTPVHVFTSGDEAELFLNGQSLGRKTKGQYEYRFRWDNVTYEPGQLKVIAYKNGTQWAKDIVTTTDKPVILKASADRDIILADGKDLAFVTVRITDKNGQTVPYAQNGLDFTVTGPSQIVATDNGDPTDLTPFPSHQRKAFNGLALAIVRGIPNQTGVIKLKVESESLKSTTITLQSFSEVPPRGEVAEIIGRYWNIGYDFEVTGPYLMAEIEKKLRADFQKKRPRAEWLRAEFVKKNPHLAKEIPVIRTYEDCEQGQSWQRLKGHYWEGDDLYFFISSKGFQAGHGAAGYALIRNQEIVYVTLTLKTDGIRDPQGPQ